MTDGPRPTLLLTAFGPFGGDPRNPTEHALHPVAEAAAASAHVIAELLPVEFDAASTRIRHLVRTHRPDVVVSLGLAAGRSAITPERVAINLAEARIPDEAGARPVGLPLRKAAPPAYFSTLPLSSMVAAVTDAGAPASLSYSAGAFVCNAVMFAGLDETLALRAEDPTAPEAVAGFVHVPQVDDDAMTQAEITRALIAAVLAALEHRGVPPVPTATGGTHTHTDTDTDTDTDTTVPGVGATQ